MGSLADIRPSASLDVLPYGRLGHEIAPDTAASDIRRLLKPDTKPHHNLGSFVTTALDTHGEQLLLENYAKNLACRHEYPGIDELHSRCVSILGDLWGVSAAGAPVGSAVSGSSEAIFLGILAMKKRWMAGRTDRDTPREPNIIVGSHAHVAVPNGASACDVQIRSLQVSASSNFVVDPFQLEALIDDGTIGIVLIMGSTYTGHFDPVKDVGVMLDKHEASTGRNIMIHVDAASGGFVAPFLGKNGGCTQWDFSNSRVASINASGHKFGLATASVGWVLWRDRACLPDSMVHSSDYLMGQNESVTLSYSQPAHGVVLQYYHLARLGRLGYERIMEEAFQRAVDLGRLLEKTGLFECVDGVYRGPLESVASNKSQQGATAASRSSGLPLVVFRLRPGVQRQFSGLDEQWISNGLMQRGFSVPCCKLPIGGMEVLVLRIVMRAGVSDEVCQRFVAALKSLLAVAEAR
ncbi:glutamate decarboxylase [Verticillium alfalfae VaMs.102]|uniref:glutamate decarboxylase n=1 Tax=Verticillium alfalfae (strain VaMs.102 / ATCC MYA-4576 / FGSC 10136) TaxID=526221 RepID=C9SUA2_VERA1|nr:glutamate decarboxylase [Verticillium alfalfae VaMs.102]EEY22413.1 glutamate decarboxylase [Verticillium alfalfae VaMs.102]